MNDLHRVAVVLVPVVCVHDIYSNLGVDSFNGNEALKRVYALEMHLLNFDGSF